MPSPARWLWLSLAFYTAVGGVALAARFWTDRHLPWGAPGVSPWPLPLRAAAGVAFGLALVGASQLWSARSPAGRRLALELAALVRGITPPLAIVLAAVSSLAEEALFRGALQPALGWLVASGLFGLAHFLPSPGLRVWSVAAGLAGLGLGALFAWSGDLVAPALAHFVLNAVNLRRLAALDVSADRGTERL